MSGTDYTFNCAKGAFAEKVRDATTSVGFLLLKVEEGDSGLKDRATVAAILAASNTECDFTNYARKTGLTGTVTVDNTNDRVDVDTGDMTFTAAGGGTNNSVVKGIFFLDEGGTDATRIPLTAHTITYTTSGNNLIVTVANFARAS